MFSKLRLLQQCAEFRPLVEVEKVPRGTRGIYALLKIEGRRKEPTRGTKFDVVYIGMSRTGIRGRLRDHVVRKSGLWTHFSCLEQFTARTREQTALQYKRALQSWDGFVTTSLAGRNCDLLRANRSRRENGRAYDTPGHPDPRRRHWP